MNSAGSGSRSRPVVPGPLVVLDVGEVARGAQQLLPAIHLAGQRVLHPADLGQVVGQVGDHGRDVRRMLHTQERRAALEVDQHHVQRGRGVGGEHAQHEGAQELRFARSGGSYAEPVRAHTALRGLLDIQLHGLAELAETDGHPQAIPDRTRSPGLGDVEGMRIFG